MTWLLRQVLALWVRFRVVPEDAAAQLRGRSHALCYVLERRSAADLAVLQQACAALRLPRPGRALGGGTHELRSFFYLTRQRGLWGERQDRRPPAQLVQMIAALRADPAADFELVPAAVYWGRARRRRLPGCVCCSWRTGRSPAVRASACRYCSTDATC